MTAEKRDIKTIPEYKKKQVSELAEKMKNCKTILIVSTKGLPSSQFHSIKKKIRDKAEVKVAKKSIILRAIKATEKGAIQNLKEQITADYALLFSDIDAFELSGLLAENQSETKAKEGDIAPEDIRVEPGPTDLMPGPAISELGSVGLKVAVENGKLAIKEAATVVKEGEEINLKVAGVLAKLGIEPMKVGYVPVAAYDSISDKVYTNIKIDKEATLEAMREIIGKALGFAVNIKYPTPETTKYFIAKAGLEAAALEKVVENNAGKKEEVVEEKPVEEVKETPVVEEEKVEEEAPVAEEKSAGETESEGENAPTQEKEKEVMSEGILVKEDKPEEEETK